MTAAPLVITHGCRLNTYESEVMRNHAQTAGLGNAVIINTCAVTAHSERDARRAVRVARRDHPQATIIVTGCAAQINPQAFAAMPEVDHVIGNDLKLQPESWQGLVGAHTNGSHANSANIQINDIMTIRETAAPFIDGVTDRARAIVQVQNGCDHRCTFCIIPFGRGNSRSVPVGIIAQQIGRLVDQGINEIVFSGVDITSYGRDLPGTPSLGQMIRRVLALNPGLPRVRLSSLDPAEMDDDLWHLIAHESRFMPYLHLSVQAGDDLILKRMKRRHNRAQVIDLTRRAMDLRPEITFGADLIAGFPTENDEMFQNTLNLIGEAQLTFLHVFPYSPRDGTPAARMPQVEPSIRKRRAAALRAAGDRQLIQCQQRSAGKRVSVLVEQGRKGRAENFLLVPLDRDYPVGSLQTVRFDAPMTGHDNGFLA